MEDRNSAPATRRYFSRYHVQTVLLTADYWTYFPSRQYITLHGLEIEFRKSCNCLTMVLSQPSIVELTKIAKPLRQDRLHPYRDSKGFPSE